MCRVDTTSAYVKAHRTASIAPVQPKQSFWSIQTIVIMGAVMLAFLVFMQLQPPKSKTQNSQRDARYTGYNQWSRFTDKFIQVSQQN